MSLFNLMHKDITCAILMIDDEDGSITAYKDLKTGYSPFLGNCDVKLIKKWWQSRTVPASRNAIQEILKRHNFINAEIYLAKNMAFSMTDTYWLKPLDYNGTYHELHFTDLRQIEDERLIPYHNASSYDPNASLGGQMEKYWDLSANTPVLVKESYKYFGQQSINEAFATLLHDKQKTSIPYVKYQIVKTEDNGVQCRCDAFTNDFIELVPAFEVLEGAKTNNEKSLYNNYIRICADLGIPKDTMQEYMDYQTLTDFIISNTDEHLMNFGILRNADTFEYIGPAPIYDSGNSMFYAEPAKALSRPELLARKITGFYESEEKLLKNVKHKDIVDPALLPSEKEVTDFYQSYGIPKEKAVAIASNYMTKIQMTHDFQQGQTISLYLEKKK